MADTVEHPFGGAWTESKLAIVNAYSRAFQTALKNTGFENWYIDPFAGTGERVRQAAFREHLLLGVPAEVADRS